CLTNINQNVQRKKTARAEKEIREATCQAGGLPWALLPGSFPARTHVPLMAKPFLETPQMPVMPGKTALLELLKQEGVRVMFGNPGTTELPLMDALAAEHELRYVLALQEAPAMGMADGYAQASGQLAVVNLHVAPGLGNAMGMLYDAQKAGAPILVTAGQHEQGFNF